MTDWSVCVALKVQFTANITEYKILRANTKKWFSINICDKDFTCWFTSVSCDKHMNT